MLTNVKKRFILFVLLSSLSFSIVAQNNQPPAIFEIDLDDNITELSTVEVRAQIGEERHLPSSYIYNFYYGDIISLYRYITLIPNVLDNQIYSGVYNLSYRGANTSPNNGSLPISIVVDSVPYLDAFRAPMNVYLIPDISDLRGNYVEQEPLESLNGVVHAKTHATYNNQAGDIWLEIANTRQGIWTKLNGPVRSNTTNIGNYGINFNFLNYPGLYDNNGEGTTFTEAGGTKPEEGRIDSARSAYVNTYFNLIVNPETDLKFYLMADNNDRGSYSGYGTTIANFNEEVNIDRINSRQVSEIDSYNNNKELVLGLDLDNYSIGGGASLFSINAFYNDGSENVRQDLSRWIYDNPNDITILEWGIYGNTVEDVNNESFNLNLSLVPITSDETYYSLGFDINQTNIDAYNISRTIGFGRSSDVLLEPSQVDASYDYFDRQLTADLYGYYKLIINSQNHISFGGRLRYYESNFEQNASLNESGTFNRYLEVINDRLALIGAPTYEEGEVEFDAEYTNTMFLPKVLWEVLDRSIASVVNIYHMQYYMGYIPGGFNPYSLRSTNFDERTYEPEIHHNAELGVNSIIRQHDIETKLTLFYTQMQDIHYAIARDSLEDFYGNVESGRSYGAEFEYIQRIHPRFEVSGDLTYTYAKYGAFEHDEAAYENRSSDFTDKRIINTPSYTFEFAANYWMLNGIYLRLENKYVGPMYFDYENELKGGNYNLLAINTGWENENFAVSIFIDNLLNDYYVKGAEYSDFNLAGQVIEDACNANSNCPAFEWENVAIKNIGTPRTFGLHAAARF